MKYLLFSDRTAFLDSRSTENAEGFLCFSAEGADKEPEKVILFIGNNRYELKDGSVNVPLNAILYGENKIRIIADNRTYDCEGIERTVRGVKPIGGEEVGQIARLKYALAKDEQTIKALGERLQKIESLTYGHQFF